MCGGFVSETTAPNLDSNTPSPQIFGLPQIRTAP